MAAYQSLPLIEQRILQLCAITAVAPVRRELISCIKSLSISSLQSQKLTDVQIKKVLNSLTQKQLIDDKGNCHSFILHDIAAIALHENNPASKNDLIIINDLYFAADRFDPTTGYNSYYYNNTLRSVHIAMHQNNSRFFNNIKTKNLTYPHFFIDSLIHLVNNSVLDMDWVRSRIPIIQLYLVCAKFSFCYSEQSLIPPDLDNWLAFLKTFSPHEDFKNTPLLVSKLQQIYLNNGLLEKRDEFANIDTSSFAYFETLAMRSFLSGDYRSTIKYYDNAVKLFNKCFDDTEHLWHALNLVNNFFYFLAAMLKPDRAKAQRVLNRIERLSYSSTFLIALNALFFLQKNDRENAEHKYLQLLSKFKTNKEAPSALVFAIADWLCFLLSFTEPDKSSEQHKFIFHNFLASTSILPAHLYAEIGSALFLQDLEYTDFLQNKTPFTSLRFLSLIPIKQEWESAIDKLSELIFNKADAPPVANAKRMVWFIDLEDKDISVYEQTVKKNGTWSDGRPIGLKRLYYKSDAKLDYLTAQDKKAISGLTHSYSGWYNNEEYVWDFSKTITSLIGHPLVFDVNNPTTPIELIEGKVELQITEKKEGYHLKLNHYESEEMALFEKAGPNKYKVIPISKEVHEIAQILPQSGLTIPFSAKEKINSIINYVGNAIHVHADIKDDNIPLIESNSTCLVHLFPQEEGFKLEVWVRPFGEQGSYCQIAKGNQTLIMTINTEQGHQRQKTIRDFKKEKTNLAHLLKHCPTLLELNEKTGEWQFNSVATCLEVLLELDNYKKNHPLIIEWPKGQTVKLKQSVSSNNLSLSIKGSKYWFEYEGELKLDNDRALDMKTLLDLLDNSEGRFIKLPDGEFLALTSHFKKQLEDLKAVSEGNKIYHLGSGALTSLSEVAATAKTDKAWQEHLKKIDSMRQYQPHLPSTLQAELREYQLEGFHYLSRLANWEIGGCLADDMGLGKTLQTIAVLLEKGTLGPSIVVAPTSVCFTWMEELTKFAPTLNPHLLSETSDRKALIQSLGAMDILISSYGLLHTAGDHLISKKWQFIILDEAQAIKNSNTKRWKYATQLNGASRIALSGTPIENHLGELWSIFRFLNPGLLGSEKHFQERYAMPIEKLQDPVAKRALKLLVSPYILRRTKSEVLQELPAKTEQSIMIEPSTEEKSFYEAVRLKALERISQLNTVNGEPKRFSILAEITRLRQACCHSLLVDQSIDIPSSKIKVFLELVQNLLDNKHKVLVFSQYVRFLKMIKSVLDKETISYQYLDGSTPIKARQQSINDFQSGEGDVFLISLKAGGTGLNLTAADYVIILDPWWNPAVEDQASARAHRIGQERPVTVYRLIMQNTMEEKIVQLHKEKRDLANDLLSGSDIAGKISEEDLIRLIAS